MSQAPDLDGVLVQWGDRLFYPGNRVVKVRPQPKLGDGGIHQRADAIRKRIESTVVKRAPQVMVKVTGGGRGMLAIAAHFRYISKNGRLGMENEQGEVLQGRSAVYELSDEWRYGGSLIGDEGHRREAFNIMLSMPTGHRPADRPAGGERVRKDRAGEPQVRDGAARPPGKPARAPQRAGRVDVRETTQPAQGRPATVARDLCRETAWLRGGGRSHPAGHPVSDQECGSTVAAEGQGGRAVEESQTRGQEQPEIADHPDRGAACLVAHWPGPGQVTGCQRREAGYRNCSIHSGCFGGLGTNQSWPGSGPKGCALSADCCKVD